MNNNKNEKSKRIDMLHHCFMSAFLNYLADEDINLTSLTPQFPPIKELINNYCIDDTGFEFTKKIFPLSLDFIFDIKDLLDGELEDCLTSVMGKLKEEIKILAICFADELKNTLIQI